MYLLAVLYGLLVLLSISSDIIYSVRYNELKKELGYINVKRSSISQLFKDSPIITTCIVILNYMFPFSVVSSIRDNIEFKYATLDDIKRDLDKGIIKLNDEEELNPVELVHKIKNVRRSIAASYLDYLEELAKKEEENINTNYYKKPEMSKIEEKKKELKKLQKKFDSTMRHYYEIDDN